MEQAVPHGYHLPLSGSIGWQAANVCTVVCLPSATVKISPTEAAGYPGKCPFLRGKFPLRWRGRAVAAGGETAQDREGELLLGAEQSLAHRVAHQLSPVIQV